MSLTDNTVKYLDLDAVKQAEVVVKLNGKSHKLKPVSVSDFVENTKLIASLGPNADLETEMATIIKMLLRSFPTMVETDLTNLSFDQLNKLLEFAKEFGGQKSVEDEITKESAGNPQTAG